MSKNEIQKDFSYLGRDFQVKLLKEIITTPKFGSEIIPILKAEYFSDQYLSLITVKIIDYWDEYDVIPSFDVLDLSIKQSTTNEKLRDILITTINEIKNITTDGSDLVKKSAKNFCKQQSLKIGVEKIEKIINTGDFDRYPECEDILRKHLTMNDDSVNVINVFSGIDDVMADDFRNPIPTGIHGLDIKMNGGLAPGELAVILAAFGVGKTTFFTVVANTAKNHGKNVLQIFFEDKPNIIKRKHYLRWYNLQASTPIDLDSISLYKEDIKQIIKQRENEEGRLELMKLPSNGITMVMIKQEIRKIINNGFKPDVLILDYIDCISPPKGVSDVSVGEGIIMREFETLLDEFNIAGWTAIQGNRSSIDTSLVQGQQMGGSIKRGQIGHFVASIGKDLPQREQGKATMAILKSRFGPDGIVFPNCTFDNKTMMIDTSEADEGLTFVENKQYQQKERDKDVAELLRKRKMMINRSQEEMDNEVENNRD